MKFIDKYIMLHCTNITVLNYRKFPSTKNYMVLEAFLSIELALQQDRESLKCLKAFSPNK
jgi:hypothetical protein